MRGVELPPFVTGRRSMPAGPEMKLAASMLQILSTLCCTNDLLSVLEDLERLCSVVERQM